MDRANVGTILICCLLGTTSLVAPSWAQTWPDEMSAPPFYYHADFSLAPHRTMLRSVSDLQRDVPQSLGLQPLRESVHVFLFQRERTYRQYVKQHFPSVPNRPALFIKQRGPGMVFAHAGRQFATDLRHETTHAVLHGILPMVPLWLDEGLGEYFEVPAADRQRAHPHYARVRERVGQGYLPNMQSLESIRELSDMKADHYRQAWAWVHFLMHHSQQTKDELVAFLRDIEASSPPGNLSDRLRRKLPNYEQAFVDHFGAHPPKQRGGSFRLSKLLGG